MPAAESSIVIKVVGGAIVSALMAVGGMSWTNHTQNETQEVRLAQLERVIVQIGELNDRLAQTNQNIAVLNVKLSVLKEDLDEVTSQ
jgi:uncharacterized coiled-coil protein SlyX